MHIVVLSASPWGYPLFFLVVFINPVQSCYGFCSCQSNCYSVHFFSPSPFGWPFLPKEDLMPSACSVTYHTTRCARTPTTKQKREGSVEPNHLQRLSERRINNSNYFKTNWKQKAQPSSVTARQKRKPQKEEIAVLCVLSTLVSSSRQMFFYLSCSPKSSSKNS